MASAPNIWLSEGRCCEEVCSGMKTTLWRGGILGTIGDEVNPNPYGMAAQQFGR